MKYRLSGGVFGALLLTIGLLVAPMPAGAAIPAPGVPQNVAVAAGGHQITISWSPPASGPAPTAYQVYGTIGNAAGTCLRVTTTVCVLTLASNLPVVKRGTTYSFKVRAFNGTKAGAYSTLVPVLFGKPTVPTAVTATAGNGNAHVSWSPSTGSRWPVTGYTVTATGGHTCTSTGTSCTVSGLSNGGTYTFTVTATNVVGTTVASAPSGPVTVGAPLAPTGVVATGAILGADVSFTAPGDNGSAIAFYTVIAHDVSNPSSPTDGSGWGNNTSPVHVPNLAAGDTYTFTVFAQNVFGDGAVSDPSNAVTLASPPSAPSGVTAVAAVRGADVSFATPDDNGSAITFYTAIATDVSNPSSPTNGSGWGNNTSPVHVPNLTPGDQYTFTVFASNAVGNGPSSAASNLVTLADLPSAPTGVTAVGASLSADISFTASASDGGSAIGYYVVTAWDQTNPSSPTNGAQWGGFSPIHQPSLTAGDSYVFTVSAANGVGQGPESASSNLVLILA